MPQYLLSGTKPDGQRVTECVIAPTADAALADFRSRGYFDEALHTDDVGALFTNQQALAADVSPAEYLGFRDHGGYWVTFGRTLWRTYLQHWYFCLFAVTFLIVRTTLGTAWGILEFIAIAGLLAPLVIVPISTAFRPSQVYDRLIEAACWGRWAEVLRLLPNLRGSIPASELTIREGQAWAGLGDLDKGLAIVKPLADGNEIPAWLYHARLVELHSAAGRWDLMVPAMEQAERLAPDNASVLLDLAVVVLQVERDVPRAKLLIARARSHALSDLVLPYAEFADGLVALEEARLAEAQRLFTSALAATAPRVASQPVFGTQVAILQAYLGLAHAALGDLPAARKHFSLARPRLEARKITPLLKRIDESLGRMPLPAK